MGFDTQNIWRVSDINCNYKYVTNALLCNTTQNITLLLLRDRIRL